jgi:hypothetical protein
MQNRQSGRRRRGGGGNNNPRPMGMQQGGQNANRLEVRVRGNAHQLLEKYKVLARDAHQAGDRVAAEYYLQHADHYFRVLNDSRIRQEEMRARRSAFDRYEDDAGGDEAEGDERDEGDEGERAERPERDRQDRQDRQDRRPRYEERGERTDRNDRNDRPMRAERPERDEAGARPADADGERPRRWQERRPERVRGPEDADGRAPRLNGESADVRLSDGEAALVAFGGVPAREGPGDAPAIETGGEAEAPRPRRRGRPRKTEVAPVEG